MDRGRSAECENGWEVAAWSNLKRPPRWFAILIYVVGSIFVFILFYLTLSALYRLTVGIGDYTGSAGADHARNLLIAIGAILATPFVVWRTWISHQQWKTSAEQISIQNDTLQTSLLTKAIELLSKNAPDTKVARQDDEDRNIEGLTSQLGALSILRRIALSSPTDHLDIVEIISSYIQGNSPANLSRMDVNKKDNPIAQCVSSVPHRDDIIKSINIIGDRQLFAARNRLISTKSDNHYKINLSHTNLNGLSLVELVFDFVNFSYSDLRNIEIRNCSFCGSIFDNANLDNIKITEIGTTTFESASFRGVNLSTVQGLEVCHIAKAMGDRFTRLPYHIDVTQLGGGWDKYHLMKTALSSTLFDINFAIYQSGTVEFDELKKYLEHITQNEGISFSEVEAAYKEILPSITGTPLPRSS